MYLRLHIPSLSDVSDSSLLHHSRLQQAIAQSFERAVRQLDIPHVQIEIVQEDTAGAQTKTRDAGRAGFNVLVNDLVHHNRFPNVAIMRRGGSGDVYAGG